MNIDAYLERIGYAGPLEPSAETLAALQRAHMLTVPFENFDIGRGRQLVLDREPIFDKVVGRRPEAGASSSTSCSRLCSWSWGSRSPCWGRR